MKPVSVLLTLVLGCAHGSPVAPPPPRTQETVAATPVAVGAAGSTLGTEVIALIELPRVETTEGLSGSWYEPATRRLYALQDTVPRIIPLSASADLRSWSVGVPIELHDRPDATWDGEALAHAGDELFVVAVESTARIERFGLDGTYHGLVPVDEHFARGARGNKGLEALAASPSGRELFYANESALEGDGPLATRAAGTAVRIVRHTLASGGVLERGYVTEPLVAGGDEAAGEMGVSDMTALSERELLVLERGYQPGYGNTARIFGVDFDQPTAGPGAPPRLQKTLLVDVGALPAGAITHVSPQPNPLLENYEALSLGPTLADGRRILLLTSDDNARAEQRPRILVLAVRLPWRRRDPP